MSLSFEDVARHCVANDEKWRNLANAIEDEIVHARDKKGIPIYLTKHRIKKPESAYLKTKRKGRSTLEDITDWVGIRILCLFHQDIYRVHEYLIKMFVGQTLNKRDGRSEISTHVREVIVFNWEVTENPEQIERAIFESLRDVEGINFASGDRLEHGERKFIYTFEASSRQSESHTLIYRVQNKGSGYKSVHYSVLIDGVAVEFQLRTLIQDVWGELEHALSYKKGKIHPHIRSSFQLLSRELRAKDILVSQLRAVSEKERSFALYARVKSGPSKWIGYGEKDVYQDAANRDFRMFLKDYLSEFTSQTNVGETWTAEWTDRMSERLENGRRIAGSLKLSAHQKYFFDMERAFLLFCRGRIDEASDIYKSYIDKKGIRYRWIVHYRLGEIQVVRGDIEDALVNFDRCEALLEKIATKDRDIKGEFFAKQKLANVFWSLGEEYFDLAHKKIIEAEQLAGCLKEQKDLTAKEEASLLNNLCYYALEKFIQYLSTIDAERDFDSVERRFDAVNEVDRRYSRLAEFIKKHPPAESSNVYDTLAWCAFNKYKYLLTERQKGNVATKDAEAHLCYLKQAYRYLEKLSGHENRSPSPLISVAIQHEHLQEIMATYDAVMDSRPV